MNYDEGQALTSRAVAIGSACASIVASLSGMYTSLALDPKRLIFRHQLIFFLLFSDLVKAMVLLVYPICVLIHPDLYNSTQFCQVMGFFTAASIEGADFAILAFAVHTLLIIFRPELAISVSLQTRTEAGLYRFRYYVYLGCLFLPLFFASVAFIGGGKDTYRPFTCWCYLPLRPIWFRYALSWGPRYAILATIIACYLVIYIHVVRKSRKLSLMLARLEQGRVARELSRQSALSPETSDTAAATEKEKNACLPNGPPSLFSKTRSFVVRTFMTTSHQKPLQAKRSDSRSSSDDVTSTPPQYVPGRFNQDTVATLVDESQYTISSDSSAEPTNSASDSVGIGGIQAASVEQFKKREKAIRRQITSIFLYPLAYMFVWFLPFILSISQTRNGQELKLVYWLKISVAFFQPLNGLIDTLVFFYRERPWQHTVMRNFEAEYSSRLSNASHYLKCQAQQNLTEPESRRNSDSIDVCTTLMGQQHYSSWRRLFDRWHLPLFALPSEETISQIEWRVTHQSHVSDLSSTRPSFAKPCTKLDATVSPLTLHPGAGATMKPSPSYISRPSASYFAASHSVPVSPTNISQPRDKSRLPSLSLDLEPPLATRPSTSASHSLPTSKRLVRSMLLLPVSITRKSTKSGMANVAGPQASRQGSAVSADSRPRFASLAAGDLDGEEIDFIDFLRTEPKV